jgi:hypothetical protein
MLFAVAGCAYYGDTGYETADYYDDAYEDDGFYDRGDDDRSDPIRWSQSRPTPLPEVDSPPPMPPVASARPTPPAPTPARPLDITPAPPAAPSAASDPFSIAGLSEREVEAIFGRPVEKSDRGPRRIWTYQQPDCSVQVMFFLDITRDAYYALDQKTSVPSGGTRSIRECLRDIRNARSD